MNIQAFDATTMRPNSNMFLLGKRGSGKSVLLKDLMYHHRDKLDFGVAMSSHKPNELDAFIPKPCLFDTYNAGVVDNMMEYQKASTYRTFVISEDCEMDTSSPGVRAMHLNGRHRNLSFIRSEQYLKPMPVHIRHQIDYVFVGNTSQREEVWKTFFSVFTDYERFGQVFDACTQNHGFMVYDATVRSHDIEDIVFSYTPSLTTPHFRLCTLWE
jgi:hypothetical protein